MALDPGTKLGPYEVLSAVGAGGMGEVYRARDTRLDRTVAIKVLPSHLSASPDVRQRFEREARTVSQLSHPNICAVFDVGREGDTGYLVMEYLQGEPLTERLAKGPLPLEQVLRIGAQLAEALDQAHRHGIVHRDVKPGNVMLTRAGVKLLDFGLAKQAPSLVHPSDAGSAHSGLATEAHLTGAGTILGTVQYMAPEQLEGKEADARTDIFALGAVLYEMVTGRKAFAAGSQASVISAIMSADPPRLASVQPLSPPLLDRLVHACLAKDPDDRVQTAHDVLMQLRWMGESSQSSAALPATAIGGARSTAVRTWLPWAIAVAGAIGAAWFGLGSGGSSPATLQPTVRSTILLPEKLALQNAVISPTGDRIVISGLDRTGRSQLWIRRMDSEVATPLAGTEGAILPFWSPDGRDLGFFADRTLKRINAAGGAPIRLWDVDGVGGTWTTGGDILFSAPSGPILRIPASGGQPSPLTALDASRGETAHRYPSMLPDGRHFLFLAMNIAGSPKDPANRISVGSLDGGPVKPIVASYFYGIYGDGYLLFIRGGDRGGSLLAQPFDPVRLETTGEPVTVAEHVAPYGDFAGLGSASVARGGVLLYDGSRLLTRLEWYDRNGQKIGSFGEPALRSAPRVSSDGTRIAFSEYDPGTQTTQVWTGDLQRGVATRLTMPPGSNATPIWSPDGSRIAYQSDERHQADIRMVSPEGGASDAVTDVEGQNTPLAWSSDGRVILAWDREPAGDRLVGLSGVPLDGDRKPFVVVPRRVSNITGASLSSDRRWLAYDTDESGRREVCVVSFPDGKGRVQVSNTGGYDPKWAQNGRELLYLSHDGRVMSVAVPAGAQFTASTPVPLFSVPEGALLLWDVAQDGTRFFFAVPVLKSSSVPLTLVQNWTAGLKR